MSLAKKLLLYFSILIIAASASKEVVAQPCGKFCTKKKFHFRLLKQEVYHSDTSIVKTNGIYMNMPQTNDGTPKYRFLRFFENGRVYLSGEYCNFPMPNTLDDLKFGFYGVYTVNGDSVLVELYDENGYGTFVLNPINNGLTEVKYAKRKMLGKNTFVSVPNNTYKFIRKQLYNQPEW